MTEPNGSATIFNHEMEQCVNHWQVLDLLKTRGVPLPIGVGHLLELSPDYEYTEHVDYDNHSITITWRKL